MQESKFEFMHNRYKLLGIRFPWTQYQVDTGTTLFHVGFLSASLFVWVIPELIEP